MTYQEYVQLWIRSGESLFDVYLHSRYKAHFPAKPHSDLIDFDDWCDASLKNPWCYRYPLNGGFSGFHMISVALLGDADFVRMKLFWPHIILKVDRFEARNKQ